MLTETFSAGHIIYELYNLEPAKIRAVSVRAKLVKDTKLLKVNNNLPIIKIYERW